MIITTGGAAADLHFSEGGVGRDYLIHRGVPERNVIAEMQGRDTAESAVRVAVCTPDPMRTTTRSASTATALRKRRQIPHRRRFR